MQNKIYRRSYTPADTALTVMLITLIFGVLIGTLAFRYMSDKDFQSLRDFAGDYFELRRSGELLNVTLSSFASSSLFTGVVFLLGFFALGQLPVFLLLIFRGVGLGAVLAYCFNSGGNAAGAVAVLVIPAVISCFALCCAAKEAVRSSGRALRFLLVKGQVSGSLDHTRKYIIRLLAAEAVTAVSALADCFCSLLILR